jgi:hypothetical protein
MPTTSDVIEIAKISVSLAIKAIENQQENDLSLPKKLSTEAYLLEWSYINNYSGIDLDGFTNYVYGMCGGYAYQAEGMIGTGGIVIDPATGGGGRNPIPLGKYAGTGNTSISFNEAIGKSLLSATRGGQGVGEIIFSGTPIDNQIKWESGTGTLYVASTVPFATGEFVRILVY